MPNIADIIEIAEVLGDRPVIPLADRCVAVRNRNATCKKCIEACNWDAIEIHNNELSIDATACVGCGACSVVCPTEALVPADPTDAELSELGASALEQANEQGRAVIACARIASKGIADPHKFAEVACMARVDESAIMELAAAGASEVLLVDGVCKTCKYRATSAGVDTTVDSANNLLATCGSAVRVSRASEFPEDMALADASSLLGEARRGFFTSAGSWTTKAAGKTADLVIRKNLGAKQSKTLRERLNAAGGTLPQFDEHRRAQTLDAMYQLGAQPGQTLTSRLFGTVSIDISKCNACGMCAVFCPTGALVKSAIKVQPNEDGTTDGGSFLEFQAADCTQCGLCVDACMKKCLTVSDEVATDELFDFDPRFIYLPKPGRRPGLV